MHTLMCTLKTDCSTSVPDYGSDAGVVITEKHTEIHCRTRLGIHDLI